LIYLKKNKKYFKKTSLLVLGLVAGANVSVVLATDFLEKVAKAFDKKVELEIV